MSHDEGITDEATIPPDHYYDASYDSLGRFVSYWHQINEIQQSGATSVLEIGIGNGFVHRYLRQHGIAVVTLDVNRTLQPDVAADAERLPFPDRAFDAVLCAEVLEHLRFEQAQAVLHEIRRVTRSAVVISVPHIARCYRVHIDVPRIGAMRSIAEFRLMGTAQASCPDHEWELGLSDYPMQRLLNAFSDAGLRFIRTYRVFEMPYHRFFILTND